MHQLFMGMKLLSVFTMITAQRIEAAEITQILLKIGDLVSNAYHGTERTQENLKI